MKGGICSHLQVCDENTKEAPQNASHLRSNLQTRSKHTDIFDFLDERNETAWNKLRSGYRGQDGGAVRKMRRTRSSGEGDEILWTQLGREWIHAHIHTHKGTHSLKVYDLQGQPNQSWALKAISLHGAQIGNTHMYKNHTHTHADAGLSSWQWINMKCVVSALMNRGEKYQLVTSRGALI